MTMKMNGKKLAPLLVGIFAAGIAIAAITGNWQTESTKMPMRIASGEFAGSYDPADIRGSYSFDDIAGAFGVPVDILARAFGFTGDEDPGGIQAKDLESVYGVLEDGEIGTDSLRYFVSLYVGIPYVPEDSTLLPAPAMSLLRDRVDEATLAEVRTRTVSLVSATSAEPAASEHESDPDDMSVRGRTTFGDLLEWGLSREQIETAIGMEMGKTGETVREYLSAAGTEFREARDALEALLAKLPD